MFATGAFQVARRGAPWSLRIVPAISTSTFGIVYDASPVTFVTNPGSTWQYGLVVPTNALASSGIAARRSHRSLTVLPLLTPALIESPFLARALRLNSTPLYTCVCFPKLSANVTLLLAAVAHPSAVRL